jgi:hypothetical protein
METEVGRQMTAALSAVRKMHFDCSRLLRDIDKEFDGYRSVYASIATTDLSYDVKTGLYMAEGLLRHYAKDVSPSQVVAVNIVFFDVGGKVTEPLFIIAKILYAAPLEVATNRNKAWDPWRAYLEWNKERKHGEIIVLEGPLKKDSILRIAVLAVPLFTIDSETRAQDVVRRVRDFAFSEEQEAVQACS